MLFESQKKETEKVFEEIMAQDFPKILNIKTPIQEVQKIPEQCYTYTPINKQMKQTKKSYVYHIQATEKLR